MDGQNKAEKAKQQELLDMNNVKVHHAQCKKTGTSRANI